MDRNEEKLAQFKQELSRYFRASSPMPRACGHWFPKRSPNGADGIPAFAAAALPGDPETYLEKLEDATRQIRITGLKTKRTEPYVFGIDEIYIPLKTLASQETMEQQRRIELQQALANRKVVIIGDPGSGKSTFLRRVAFELCRTLRGTLPGGRAPVSRRRTTGVFRF